MLLAVVFRTVQRTLETHGVCNVLGEERAAASYFVASQQASLLRKDRRSCATGLGVWATDSETRAVMRAGPRGRAMEVFRRSSAPGIR